MNKLIIAGILAASASLIAPCAIAQGADTQESAPLVVQIKAAQKIVNTAPTLAKAAVIESSSTN